MSELGLSPEDQEAPPSADETPTDASPASDEIGAEASPAAEETPAEAGAEPEEASTDSTSAPEGAAAVSAPAARSGGGRRALSWAAVVAVVVVVVLLATTLLVSHQSPAHSTTSGHATATAVPVPLSVYGMVSSPTDQGGSFPFPVTPVGTPVLQPAATQVTPNEFALNAADGSLRWVDPTPNGAGEGQVVANGVVYVGLSDGEVDALDAGTGKQLWSTTLLTFSAVQQVVDGVVYGWATNDLADNNPNGKFEVYALDAKTGKQLWQYDAGSVDLVAGGVVYVTTYTGSSTFDITGVVHALDASTGTERWHVQIPGMLEVQMVSDGQLYVLGTQYTQGPLGPTINPASHTTLYVVDVSSGAKQWSYPKSPTDPMSLLGVDAGVVSLFVQPGLNLPSGPFGALPADSLVGLNAADGSARWKTEIPLPQNTSGGTVTTSYMSGLPAGGLVSNGVLYIASPNDPPSAYNASTGKLLWSDPQFLNGEQFPVLNLALVANRVLYLEDASISANIGLYALNASTGKVLWKALGTSLVVSAVVNGMVYTSASDAENAMLGSPVTGPSGIFALDATTGAVRWSYGLGSQTVTITVQ